MNIAEILAKCPKGTKLYSSYCGECVLIEITDKYNIWVRHNASLVKFDSEGRISNEGECLLFPSKNQRDWSKFVVPREDLAEGTPCVCFDEIPETLGNVGLRYYAKNGEAYCQGKKDNKKDTISWDYIIPVDKFNFNDCTFNKEDNYGTAYKKI